jgi:hypothetical protein
MDGDRQQEPHCPPTANWLEAFQAYRKHDITTLVTCVAESAALDGGSLLPVYVPAWPGREPEEKPSDAHKSWSDQRLARSRCLAENRRRLRTAMWMQWTFFHLGNEEAAGKVADMIAKRWGVLDVNEKTELREQQIHEAVLEKAQ